MEAENFAISTDIDAKVLLRTARNAALSAGAFQLQQFACQSNAITRNSEHDLKLKVDQLSETIVMDTITHDFPDHAILSEEKGFVGGRSDFLWIIDPLDGTVNYYFGLPLFCVCVACYRRFDTEKSGEPQGVQRLFFEAQPLVGVVYAPMLNRLYCAAAGHSATWNDRKIFPPPDISLQDAVIGLSFGSDESTIAKMETINRLLVRRSKKIRILGATGLDLAHVAMGNLGALVQQKVQSWDIAASLVILAQSGCRFDLQPNGDGSWRITAGSPALYRELKDIVLEAG